MQIPAVIPVYKVYFKFPFWWAKARKVFDLSVILRLTEEAKFLYRFFTSVHKDNTDEVLNQTN